MNIEVGDRVTYKDKNGKICIITIIEDKGDIRDDNGEDLIPLDKIIKVERPKYEVIK